MNEDGPDRGLSALLDAAVRRIEPDVAARLPEVLRRGGRRRSARWTAIGTALAVFVGAVAWGAVTVGHGGVEPINVASWSEYRDPQGWSARYPRSWYVQAFSTPVGLIDLEGAFFSNVVYDFHHPHLGPGEATSNWDLAGLPRHAVAIDFQLVSGELLTPTGRNSNFPISLDNARPNAASSRPPDGESLWLPVTWNSHRYQMWVFLGPDVSHRDRTMASLIVRSITFGPDMTDWAKAGSLDTTGWGFAYPPDWTLQTLPACPNASERTGAVVTNVDFAFRNSQSKTPACDDRLDLTAFPSDGVAFALEPVGIRFGLAFPELNTPFPLSWDQLVPAGDEFRGPPEHYLGITVKNDLTMMVRAWVGRSASPRAIEDLKATVASLDVRDATHWATYHNPDEGFSVTYPDDWFRAASSLTPVLASPTEILSLGTYPIQPGGKACFDAYLPGNALADLGQADVFVTVQKTSPERMPPRPATIGPDSATVKVDGLPACDPYHALQLKGWWIPFADQGQGFYVFVGAGPFAANDQQTMAIVWHVVNSLRFEP
jgi:hypothetical protein